MTLLGAARQRAGALFAVVGILVLGGVYATTRMPASIFPSVTFPIVKVISDVGEVPAIQMMPTVTRPLEEAILRVPGIELLRSTTSRGSSELSAQFAWGTDMEVALQRVQAETQRIRSDLPPDTRIDVEWMNTSVFPILGYALTSDSLSQAELWELAEYTLKPALVRIHGVSQVQIEGGRRREFQVRLDSHALQGRGLSAADVVKSLQESNLVLSAGLTERNHELYLSLLDGRVRGIDDLSRFSVPVPGGPPVELASLGEIRVTDQVRYTLATANGREAVLVNIVREPAGNTVAIAKGVRALIRDRGVLPPAARWNRVYDQARYVSESLRGARDAIAIGMLLAALVLFAFLRDLRPTLIAVAALPIAVSIVGLVLGFTGGTLNLMTLAGVAASLGLIADDAIVVIEEITHERASGRAAGAAVSRLLPALIGSSLSTTVILLPFVLLPGVAGAFFKPLALTMAVALGASFVVAALVLPVAVERFDGYSRRTGTQLGFFITEPNSGDFVINLKARGQRRGYDEIVEELRGRIEGVEPAVHIEFGQLLEDEIGDLTGGEPQPIDVKLMGSDTGLLEARARQVAQILREIRGVDDVFDGIVIAGPALQIRVAPEAAARYGLTTTDLHAQLEPALAGSVAGHVPIGDRLYDLRVLAPGAGELGDVPVRAGGALLRLRDLAELSTGPAEAEINREDLKTYVGVTARLAGRDLGGAMAEIRTRIERDVTLGPGMSVEYGGQYAQQQRSFADLLLVLLAGLVLVSVVVLFEFGDWRAPLVTSLCALAVLPGVLGALALAGMTLNISSYVGAIMMVGIVGENAIFVIHEARQALARGLSPEDAWRSAARRRLRPVAMTVLATSFALAPLALAIGSGAQLVQPLAVAVIGGLALAGPIVLLLLPGVYALLDPKGALGTA